MLDYLTRSKICSNQQGKALLELMSNKKTNLAIAADVTSGDELLEIANLLGSQICVLKTHIDIIENFSKDLVIELSKLAKKYDFLLFEDRKFADIGNTVKQQYYGGIYHIADWAHIINAHTISGPGIIEGLQAMDSALKRGLLLITSMSSSQNLIDNKYTEETIKLAEKYRDFVIGFITAKKLITKPYFINFIPGVNLQNSSDNLKQQYVTPSKAILEYGADVIIVGRGIYNSKDPLNTAKQYREIGWQTYQQSLKCIT